MTKNNTADKITAKDIYNELWMCRNFEINNLWQRSVFLAVFLLALAAGYGTLVIKIIFSDFSAPSDCTSRINFLAHSVASGICILGLVFSILWIMMAKGSKYWYERFEWSINYFTQSYDMHSSLFDGNSIQECCYNEWQNKGNKSRDFPFHGSLAENTENDFNIFSTDGGKFSPSKINIVIGIIGFIVWSFLFIIHFNIVLSIKFGMSVAFSSMLAIVCWSLLAGLLYFLISSLTKKRES